MFPERRGKEMSELNHFLSKGLHNYFIFATENAVVNTINVWHMMGRLVGRNTVKYITTFLYSDWLHFLWHGINKENNL